MPRTRSKAAGGATKTKAAAAAAASTKSSSSAPVYILAPELETPPRLLVIPKSAGPHARIITLRNPRQAHATSARSARYLVCPDGAFFEFTRVCAPRSAPRSWLVEGDASGSDDDDGDDDNHDEDETKEERSARPKRQRRDAQATKNADLLVASPIDPLFLLLPALAAVATPGGRSAGIGRKGAKGPPERMFLSVDDHLDAMCEERDASAAAHEEDGYDNNDDDDDAGSADNLHPPSHLAALLRRWPAVRTRLEVRMAAVCDAADAGGEPMYRLSEAKLQREIMAKAQRMVGHHQQQQQPGAGALPPSMEDRFVTKPLEAPILGVVVVRRSNPVTGADGGEEKEKEEDKENASPATNATPALESQSSTGTTTMATTGPCPPEDASSPSKASKKASLEIVDTVHAATCASEEVRRLQRLRVAFGFICSRYVAPSLAEVLKQAITTTTTTASAADGKPTANTTVKHTTAKPKTTSAAKKADQQQEASATAAVVDFAPLDAYLARLAAMRKEAAASRAGDYSRKRGAGDEEEEDSRAEKRRKKEDEEKAKKASITPGARALAKVNTKGMMKLSAFFKKN